MKLLMDPSFKDPLAQYRQQRTTIVQGLLWILLVVVAATVVLNAFLLGPSNFSAQAFGPNLAFAALILVAMWLNQRGRFRLAVALVIGLTVLAASLPPFLVGIAGNEITLFLFYIPLVLAGLLLDRRALFATAAWTIVVVVSATALHGGPIRLGDPLVTADVWSSTLQFVLVYVVVTFFLERFGLTFQRTLQQAIEQASQLNREMAERLRTSDELEEEKLFSDAVIQSLPGLFYVRDEDGSYVKWNRNFERTLGYEASEITQLGPLALFDGGDRDLVASRFTDVFEDGHASAEVKLIRKDGVRLPYHLNATRVSLGGLHYLVGIGIDRSDIDAAQEQIGFLNKELQERLDRLTALREIDRAIIGSLDLDLTLRVVLEQVRSRLHVDSACILLYRPRGQMLRYGACQGFRGTGLRRSELRLGEGLAGRAGLQRETVTVQGSKDLLREFGPTSPIELEGFESYLAVPLTAKGQLQGVLELFHRSAVDRDEDWHDFLDALAAQTAIALNNASLFENLERSNNELRLAYDTTIEGWARALDLKDGDTEGHSRRVTDLTVRLARKFGMSEEELVHVRRGALLHDIGKMGVPDRILLKPGKLEPDEWEVMKEHTSHGYRMLSSIAFLRPALDIPLSHHEKWDGSGYPQGLRGEQIPLAARLFAAVDVFDALTSDRPYRKALSEDQALAHIREGSGQHFDPAVSEGFLELMQDLRETATVDSRP